MQSHQIRAVSVNELRPQPRNARTHSKKQIRQIAESIRSFGFTSPILIDENYAVLAGVIARQYHTYFDWDRNNANRFFGLFGSDFQDRASRHVKGDAELDKSIGDFIELGSTRNRLVHLNYVSFDVDKSPEDIITLYRSALTFIKFLRQWLVDGPPLELPSATAKE
jgi:hypothetical protein